MTTSKNAPAPRAMISRAPFAIGVALLAVLLTTGWVRAMDRAVAEARKLPPLLTSRAEPPSGKQYVVILIGDSRCGACQAPELPPAVLMIKNELRRQAIVRDAAMASVAVVLDRDFDSAVRWIEAFGSFDEVALGGGWLSNNAIAYVWREHPGRAQTPQMLILERDLDISAENIRVTADNIILRRAGLDQITAWAAEGAPLPL